MPVQIDEKLLDERLAELEKSKAWSPRLVSKLETLIRSEDDYAVFRVNPLRFGAERGIAEAESVDLFLHAAARGLMRMDWLLLCPGCSCAVESFHNLNHVHTQFHCTICQADFVAMLDDYIAVAFTVAPAIRRIAYHDPQSLSAVDYCLRYRMTDWGLLPDGTPFSHAMAKLQAAAVIVPPGDSVEASVEAEAGNWLVGNNFDSDAIFAYEVSGASGGAQTAPIVYRDDVCTPPKTKLGPGRVSLRATNEGKRRAVMFVTRHPGAPAGPALTLIPYLSGKRVITTQCFRDLFRSEVVGGSEGIGVEDITLLFTDLKGSTALYDRIGDLNAFALVQEHFERLRAVTARHRGSVVKTIGDAVMAAFAEPADAVAAGLDMLDAIEEFNRRAGTREVVLKVGVHRGPAIVVTLNDRLDYFGQTVNIAARIQGLADAEEIFITEDVRMAPGVVEAITKHPEDRRMVQLKGVAREMAVFRLGARPMG